MILNIYNLTTAFSFSAPLECGNRVLSRQGRADVLVCRTATECVLFDYFVKVWISILLLTFQAVVYRPLGSEIRSERWNVCMAADENALIPSYTFFLSPLSIRLQPLCVVETVQV